VYQLRTLSAQGLATRTRARDAARLAEMGQAKRHASERRQIGSIHFLEVRACPRASATITARTGKYTGITGGWTYVAHVNEFRTAVEGTYAVDCTNSGNYKLP
jgi:hypothetical protein